MAELQDTEVDLKPAIAALERGDLQAADGLVKAVLQAHPEHAQALHLKGLVLRRVGRVADAVEIFNRSLAANEDQPAVYNNLGIALASLGRREEAEESYRQALKLHPTFHDAAFNLALVLMDGKKWVEAGKILAMLVRVVPGFAKAYEALTVCQRECGDIAGSVASAEKATQLAPQSHVAHHNLGAALFANNMFPAAQRAYEAAVRIRPEFDVSWIGLGNALRAQDRIGDAAKVYERAVNVNPGNPDAHQLLNEMLWQGDDVANYLESYRWALKSRPDDVQLRLAYANQLLRIQKADEAKQELLAAATGNPKNPHVNDAIGRALSTGGDYELALQYHRRAIDVAPDEAAFYKSFVESMLKGGRHEQARDWAKKALEFAPLDQVILALYTTALRLCGDQVEHDRIADYATVPKAYDLEVPAGYRDIAAFNEALAQQLRKLHTARHHPTDQTLRGGTQTFGALFSRQHPTIAQFQTVVSRAVEKYIASMPDDPDHPLFRRKSKKFAFSGSWSVRLGKQGFHTNHLHPEGWISSAYYVTVPEAAGNSESRAGWFKMGETNLELGEREQVLRYEQAKPGRLVLFPSYFWHGTVPFETDEERLTIAFDVVPT